VQKRMYLVFDLIEHDFELVDTEKEASIQAEKYLQSYRDEAATDGWPEDIAGSVGYAEVKVNSQVTKTEKKSNIGEEDWPYSFDEIWYVDLTPVHKEEKIAEENTLTS